MGKNIMGNQSSRTKADASQLQPRSPQLQPQSPQYDFNNPPRTPQGGQTPFQRESTIQRSPSILQRSPTTLQRSASSPTITSQTREYPEMQDNGEQNIEDIERNEEDDEIIIIKRKDNNDGEDLTFEDYINKNKFWRGDQEKAQKRWVRLAPSDNQDVESTIDQQIEEWKTELKKNMCGTFSASCTLFEIKVASKKLGPKKNVGHLQKINLQHMQKLKTIMVFSPMETIKTL